MLGLPAAKPLFLSWKIPHTRADSVTGDSEAAPQNSDELLRGITAWAVLLVGPAACPMAFLCLPFSLNQALPSERRLIYYNVIA